MFKVKQRDALIFFRLAVALSSLLDFGGAEINKKHIESRENVQEIWQTACTAAELSRD